MFIYLQESNPSVNFDGLFPSSLCGIYALQCINDSVCAFACGLISGTIICVCLVLYNYLKIVKQSNAVVISCYIDVEWFSSSNRGFLLSGVS